MTRGNKNDFPSLFKGNMNCKLNYQDLETIDCQEHILLCKTLIASIKQQVILKEVKYSDLFGNTEKQRNVFQIYISLLNTSDETLASLPMGNDIGPSITGTPM